MNRQERRRADSAKRKLERAAAKVEADGYTVRHGSNGAILVEDEAGSKVYAGRL